MIDDPASVVHHSPGDEILRRLLHFQQKITSVGGTAQNIADDLSRSGVFAQKFGGTVPDVRDRYTVLKETVEEMDQQVLILFTSEYVLKAPIIADVQVGAPVVRQRLTNHPVEFGVDGSAEIRTVDLAETETARLPVRQDHGRQIIVRRRSSNVLHKSSI